jgi:hypothetical protein
LYASDGWFRNYLTCKTYARCKLATIFLETIAEFLNECERLFVIDDVDK